MSRLKQLLYEDLAYIYGDDIAQKYEARLYAKLNEFQAKNPELLATPYKKRFEERDAILITYGDMVNAEGNLPLKTLADFLIHHVKDAISTVHLLPIFPYSSDDGFSVIDFNQVDPVLGDWSDIDFLGKHFRLMFDAVINHISAKSDWYQGFLRGDPDYQDHFILIKPEMDLSKVFRPRALPLKTAAHTPSGEVFVWTTFSDDQIDLNYHSPDVLLDMLEVLLSYVRQGAEFIRLDAIAFIWKESGTSCIHLPQTHRIIQLIRTVFDWIAPGVSIITETNVPHEENISYFGDGRNEAQMVYNFSLPPLTLHAFQIGNAEVLSKWADSLTLPSRETTFFNFLASHDGIGLTPVRGILPDSAIQSMCDHVEALGGYISYKDNPDGSRSPYELNINYLDALRKPEIPVEQDLYLAKRFLASQAIMLALRGVPGIYFHSLFGSRGWPEGVQKTGRYRTINRQKLSIGELERSLSKEGSLRNQIFTGYKRMLTQRNNQPAFQPTGKQLVMNLDGNVFGLRRSTIDDDQVVICLHNVSDKSVKMTIDGKWLPHQHFGMLTDILSEESFDIKAGSLKLELAPYEVLWLAP